MTVTKTAHPDAVSFAHEHVRSRFPVTIRVGGVPEHFNVPWHQAIEDNSLAEAGLDVQWTEYSTGTGAMMKVRKSFCMVFSRIPL